jgi:predicted NAD-dependent protein-ADP-ribosyltransferase YbiA (DUF1768 family)
MDTIQHLYIIGNGFDRHHGALSCYTDFRHYLMKTNIDIVKKMDLYFGHRSLWRTFNSPPDFYWSLETEDVRKYKQIPLPQSTWANEHLWKYFEKFLSELSREKIFDVLDMTLPTEFEDDENFSYAAFYAPIDNVREFIQYCTVDMKYHFHRWVNTLHYTKFKKRMLQLDRKAALLNFNYTLFLESEYKIPHEQILYLHGSRLDKLGSVILGHNADPEQSLQMWMHKNKNRRRYRQNLKDKKGRYFANDKLAYLAYFLDENEDEIKGNWRNPTRYYATDHVVGCLEEYYATNFKNTGEIIRCHENFFSSLREVTEITVLGHSLGEVDIPYFNRIVKSAANPSGIKWSFSYYTESDKKIIKHFCRRFSISADLMQLFTLSEIGENTPVHQFN